VAATVGCFDEFWIFEDSGDERVLEVDHAVDIPADARRSALWVQHVGVDKGQPIFSEKEVVGAELKGLGFFSEVMPKLGDGFTTEEVDAFAVLLADGEGLVEQFADLFTYGCCLEIDFLKDLPLDFFTEDAVRIELVFSFVVVDGGSADDTGFGNGNLPVLVQSEVFCDCSGTALIPGDEDFSRHLDEGATFDAADTVLRALSDPF